MCKTNGDGHQHHANGHAHGKDGPAERVRVDRGVLDKNDQLAEYNRGWLAGRPAGAGPEPRQLAGGREDDVAERTVCDLADQVSVSVIEGDQETDNDARRIRAAGCRAVQINTEDRRWTHHSSAGPWRSWTRRPVR